jgi:hypothetical protein
MQLIFFLILAALYIFLYIRNDRDKADREMDQLMKADNTQETEAKSMIENTNSGKTNPELMKEILTKLNCGQIQVADDEHAWFTYQGEHFCVQSTSENYWVRIYDVQWFDCPLDDLDKISCMQKAINYCNARQACTACYSIDTDKNQFQVYSKCDFLLSYDFPSPETYFEAWLNMLFRLKHEIVLQFDAEKMKQGVTN